MSTLEDNLKRDIETLKLSIKQLWQEIDREPDAQVRAKKKRVIAQLHVPDLKELLLRLEGPHS